MKCFNCYFEFTPTLSEPVCKQCGFCYYCRDFACPHHNAGINPSWEAPILSHSQGITLFISLATFELVIYVGQSHSSLGKKYCRRCDCYFLTPKAFCECFGLQSATPVREEYKDRALYRMDNIPTLWFSLQQKHHQSSLQLLLAFLLLIATMAFRCYQIIQRLPSLQIQKGLTIP